MKKAEGTAGEARLALSDKLGWGQNSFTASVVVCCADRGRCNGTTGNPRLVVEFFSCLFAEFLRRLVHRG